MKELIVKIYKDFVCGPMGENKERVLRETSSKIKGQYWLSSGTALGMFRDNDFTERDTDIDYGMLGYEGIREDILSWFDDCELIQDVFYNGRPQQVSFIKDGIIFEFVIYWLEGNEYVQVSIHGRQSMPKEVFERFKTIECKYGKFPLPEDHNTYFQRKIGDDWEIPKQSRRQYEQI
jgi:hypothetical protein